MMGTSSSEILAADNSHAVEKRLSLELQKGFQNGATYLVDDSDSQRYLTGTNLERMTQHFGGIQSSSGYIMHSPSESNTSLTCRNNAVEQDEQQALLILD